MKVFIKITYTLFLICGVTPLLGQTKKITNQQFIWYNYQNNLWLNHRFFLVNEIHERRFINPDNQHQFALRTHLHYKTNAGWDMGLGFAYFSQNAQPPYNDLLVPEFRPHIELNYKQLLSERFLLIHRYKAEYRVFRNASKSELTDGYRTNFRFRYSLGAEFRLFYISEKKPFKVKISDEILLNVGKNIVHNVFDQNRIYMALNYMIFENFNIEAGYLNSFQQTSSGEEFYNRDIIRLGINHTIPLRKK